MGLSIFEESHPLALPATLDSSDATDPHHFSGAANFDYRLDHAWATNASDHPVVVRITRTINGSDWDVGTVLLPAFTGQKGNASIDLFVALFGVGNAGMAFRAGDLLGWAATVTLGDTDFLLAVAEGGYL